MLKTIDDDNVSLLGTGSVKEESTRMQPSLPGDATSSNGPAKTLDAVLSTNIQPDSPREERCDHTYYAFLLQGLGMLFPWNVFITAAAYYRIRFRGMPQHETFEQEFSFAYTISNLIALLLIVVFGKRYSESFTFHRAVVIPNGVTAIMFLLTATMVFLPAIEGAVLYAITIICVLCCGIFAASLQAGIFGLSNRLPAKYVQAVVGGQAVSGTVVSLISLITLSSSKCDSSEPSLADIQPQSFAFFLSCTVIVGVTLIVFYWIVLKSKVVREMVATNDTFGKMGIHLIRTPVLASSSEQNDNPSNGQNFEMQLRLIRRIWRHCLGVCLTFAITLSLFPGVTARIASSHNPKDDLCHGLFGYGVWTSFLFLIFNTCDYLGRHLTLWGHLVRPERVWWLAIGRVVFIPLMLGCNLRGASEAVDIEDSLNLTVAMNASTMGEVVTGKGSWRRGVFSSDFWPVLFVAAMAVTNGYCAGLEMMNAPNIFTRPREQSYVGTVMGFWSVSGMFLGSLLGMLLAVI